VAPLRGWDRRQYVQEAIDKYTEATEVNRGIASPELALGNLHEELWDFAQAVRAHERGIAAQPGDATEYVALALAFLEDDERTPEEALEQVEQALSLSPGSAEAYTAKADVLSQGLGQREEALSLYEQAIKIDPSQSGAYLNTVNLHLFSQIGSGRVVRHDLNDFIKEWEALRDADPGQAWAHGMLGYAYKAEGSTAKSIEAFSSLLESVPDYGDAHCELAELYERTNQREQAIDRWGTCALLTGRSLRGANAEGHRDLLNGVVIASPADGAVVSGIVEIRGSATLPDLDADSIEDDFQFYKVELRAGEDPTSWSVIEDIHESTVVNDVLATFDTSDLEPGIHTLRLTLVNNVGNFLPQHHIQVLVR
jgi:tetratricopeptide (TPR) repeat protein